ncbi:uncharacterized protein LOC135123543 isoform X2 [Zophobas morio]
MEKYVRDADEFENSTLINFADGAVSNMSNSVAFLIESIHQQVTSQDFLYLFSESFDPTMNNYFCTEGQSAAQILHNFMNELLVLNVKSYTVICAAYMIKNLYKSGNFSKEIEDTSEQFQKRINTLMLAVKPYMAKTSTELWRCDPYHHEKEITYIEITNFLHGIILNQMNLDPRRECRDGCDTFTYTEKYNCQDEWCKEEITCPKVMNCRYIDSSMEVCRSSNIFTTNRRYDYIEFTNGNRFGEKNNCSSKTIHLETYRNWLIYGCAYCYCLCEEGPKFFSDRYINMRLVQSNVTDNKVVTGLRFVRHYKVIHLQVQEGRLLPYGQIDVDSVRWVPLEDYSVLDKTYRDGKDYYTFKWDQRHLDLADIMAEEGSVVTGVAFKKVDTRLHLQVQTTPFNFITGKLTNKLSSLRDDPGIALKHRFDSQLQLDRVDVPTRSRSPSHQFTTNKLVEFTNTGYEKDAGQTTVPFFDAQPLESAIPVPLVGVGVFHKGKSGFGGFITPRIFTYNFTKHLGPVFSLDKNGRLRIN